MSTIRPLQEGPRETRRRGDGGFTLIEVLVASALLVIGALATLALLDNGARATSTSRQQDVGNALAQEVVERATGGRNVLSVDADGTILGRNDMTDVDPTAPTSVVGPADRMRTAMDRAASTTSGPVTPATITSGLTPVNAPQSWTVVRGGTTYTVSYRACTTSDPYQAAVGQYLTISGPYDCARSTHDLGGKQSVVPGAGGGASKCNLLSFVGSTSGTSAGAGSADPISIGIQLLSLVGLDACLGPNLAPLTTGLCTIVGTGGVVADLLKGLAGSNGLLGELGVGAVKATLCDPAQIAPPLPAALRLTASGTRIAVTVDWTDRQNRSRTVSRTTLVRRPA